MKLQNRRTGATEFLIQELCESLIAGQPRFIVWVHARHYIQDMMQRIVETLKLVGMNPEVTSQTRVECNGSEILFMVPRQNTHGLRGYGDFVDHHALNNKWVYEKFVEREDFTPWS